MESVWKMEKLSKIMETYIKEEPTRDTPPKSERIVQIEEFAHNKGKRSEIIKAWTKIEDHPEATDMSSEVGSAFQESDLDDQMAAAYEAVGEHGIIFDSYENTFWLRHKGLLIRVL